MAAINLPRVIRIGGGCLAELPQVLEQAGLSRPLVVQKPQSPSKMRVVAMPVISQK